MCGKTQNKQTCNHSCKSVCKSHQDIMAVAPASSVPKESCVTASCSEALSPSPLLCVRQIRVSISGQLSACWLNPKRQPLQGASAGGGGGEIWVPKVWTALSEPKLTQIISSPHDGSVIPGFSWKTLQAFIFVSGALSSSGTIITLCSFRLVRELH